MRLMKAAHVAYLTEREKDRVKKGRMLNYRFTTLRLSILSFCMVFFFNLLVSGNYFQHHLFVLIDKSVPINNS